MRDYQNRAARLKYGADVAKRPQRIEQVVQDVNHRRCRHRARDQIFRLEAAGLDGKPSPAQPLVQRLVDLGIRFI